MVKLLLTSSTSLSDIASFTGKLQSTAVLHAKYDKAAGGTLIYASKGYGTGFKRRLDPDKIERRRIRAGRALDEFAQKNDVGIALRQKIAGKAGALSVREKWGTGLIAGELKELALLPSSVIVDNQRYFSGKQIIHAIPRTSERTPDLNQIEGKSISQFVSDIANQALQKKATQTYLGEAMPSQAHCDLWRFSYAIPKNDGKIFNSSEISDKAQGTRNECILAALDEFTGDKKAAVTLSSVLTQDTLIHLPYLLSSDLMNAKNIELNDGKNKVMIAGQEDKVLEALPAMGAAKWTLAKEEGYFKVSIDWTTYLSNRGGQLQLAEGNLVQAKISMELLVDAAELKKGNVSISVPNGLNIDYAGRLHG